MHDAVSNDAPRQLHVVATLEQSAGGEALAALRLSQSLETLGCRVVVYTQAGQYERPARAIGTKSGVGESPPTQHKSTVGLWSHFRSLNALLQREKIEVIHLHGLWKPFLSVAGFAACRASLPIVISPHGCLETWALSYKSKKKRIALMTYQGMLLRSASLFYATSSQELASIRGLGFQQPVAVLPNGVDVDSTFRRRRGCAVDKKILFLSRIHPIKGLRDLIEAWGIVRRPGWKIIIAGGDADGHRRELEDLITASGLREDFNFIGHVEGRRKQACFGIASIFILPSYSENFGIAIAEALANGVPVITTTGTPWRDLTDFECGWWVEPGVAGISKALLEAMKTPTEELIEMGKRGKQLMLEKYSWENIGQQAMEVTKWLLDRSRPMPSNIETYRPTS